MAVVQGVSTGSVASGIARDGTGDHSAEFFCQGGLPFAQVDAPIETE